ncbi:MAG: hypothetical protein JOY59_08070, partial [Candidatus Eremiobacteraeota bacterium]|nr:hypothetical protein [Candidatus Eremiobacteraeota bacterium]
MVPASTAILFPDKPIVFPSAEVSSLPTQAPTPTPIRKFRKRHSRTTFGIQGNATVSESAASGTQSAQSRLTNVFGMQATLEHRMDWGDIALKLPASVSLQGSQIGDIDAEFATRRALFSYRTESASPLGVVPLGVFPLAFGILERPRQNLDLQLVSGAFLSDGDRGFKATEFRGHLILPVGIASFGLIDGRSDDGASSLAGLTAGFATPPKKIDFQVEGVLERTHGMTLTADSNGALAYQFRVDDGGQQTYTTFIDRYISPSFVTLGASSVQSGDRYDSLSYRTTLRKTKIGLESVNETLLGGLNQSAANEFRNTLTLGRTFGRAETSLNLSATHQTSLGYSSWFTSANESLGLRLTPRLSLSEVLGFSRETGSSGLGVSTQYGLGAGFDPAQTMHLEGGFDHLGQSAGFGGSETQDIWHGSVSRRLRLFDLGLGDSMTHSRGVGTDSLQNAVLFTLTRQL